MRARGSIGLVLASAILAACGQRAPSPSLSPSPSPAQPSPSAASAAPSLPSGSAPPSASGGPIPFDEHLLAILPAEIDGFPVTADPESAAQAASDPALRKNAAALATGVVVDPAAGEFAIASVVQLEPGVLTDAFYRSWRDSFDEGACSQAGGVVRHAEAEIAGRKTYIGTCAGGVRTYHVALDDLDILVSISSLGDRRLGERLVAGLQP